MTKFVEYPDPLGFMGDLFSGQNISPLPITDAKFSLFWSGREHTYGYSWSLLGVPDALALQIASNVGLRVFSASPWQ